MKKWKQRLSKNRLMCFLSETTRFGKLIIFFIPIFIFLPIFQLFEYFGDAVPFGIYWLGTGASLAFIVAVWAYLIINAQVHWDLRKKCLTANILSIILLLIWLIPFFLYI